MDPIALAWITAGIAVPAAVLVYVFIGTDMKWAVATGLTSVLLLLTLFAYTANIITALYTAVSWPPDPQIVQQGVMYQRVAAGQLAAASFIVGILAVGYYMEISKKRGHE
ncbi:hypothetical protein Pogu_1778 [Pyrobaculum oguniense TE7]|uniref:Uncharacterized protein n=2 Tax=Pyrobaculum oguniense TaxID=99007 RepID=H6Q9D7_PYROT|nr:hypothetical protein Pogu_1778 [Pyrobaculum oguniense TE7]